MKYITKKEAEKIFKEEILIHLNKKDKVLARTSWNDFTDTLYKDNQISENQYNNWTQPRFCK